MQLRLIFLIQFLFKGKEQPHDALQLQANTELYDEGTGEKKPAVSGDLIYTSVQALVSRNNIEILTNLLVLIDN